MKIKTQEDVKALEQRVHSELGIDLTQYKNPEIGEKIGELLVFPEYVIRTILIPIGVALALFLLPFYLSEVDIAWKIAYSILGPVLFIVNGILVGILLVIRNIKKDTLEIIEFTMNILKECVKDLKNIKSNTTADNRKESLSLLYKGITHVVIIPIAANSISNAIPLIGGLFSGIVLKLLRLFASKVQFTKINELKEAEDPKETVDNMIQGIDNEITIIDTIMTVLMRVVQTPVFITTVITMGILAIFIFIIFA